jgi:L-amino acid N-acyltransferase YncA
MSAAIRLAQPGDAAGIVALYGPYCERTAVSFETVAPGVDDMAARVAHVLRDLPWLVVEDQGRVAGYAYASRHHERAAYMWAVDTAVYVAPSYQRQGVGRALYATLLAVLRQLGYYRACAGVTLPNEGSIRLHESFGYTMVGTYRRIGCKFGRWHDVSWFEFDLQSGSDSPPPPLSLSALTVPGWDAAVAAGLRHLALR